MRRDVTRMRIVPSAGWVLAISLFLFGAPVAHAQSGELVDTIKLPANGQQKGKFDLKAGTQYTLVVSGTRQLAGAGSYTEQDDAFYCFKATTQCATPKETDVIRVFTSRGETPTLRQYIDAGKSPAYSASHEYTVTFTPKANGAFIGNTSSSCGTVNKCSGTGFTLKILSSGDEPTLTAKITAIEGEVAIRFNEGEWRPLKVGDKVGEDAELFTGVDSRLVVTFTDGTTFELRQLSQLLVDTILRRENRKDVAIRLRVGELNANVKKEKVVDTNFEVQSPTATTSVRGTRFSVFYDPVGRATLVSVKEGTVNVDAVAPALATASVNAGQEVEVTAKAITPLAAIGKAGARGGVNRAKALTLVAAALAKAKKGCELKTPRSPAAFGLKTAPAGWLVSVRVSGKARGKSTWNVKGGRAGPKNAVAKRIARRCR